VDTCRVEELNTAVKKKVFMKLKEPDPTMRVMNVFTDYLMLLSERKMDSFVDENPKLAIQHIVTALRPLALQEKIHNDLILYKLALAKDWHKFYAYVTEKTVALDQFLPAIEQIRRKPEEVRDVKKGSRKDAKAPHLSTKPQSAVSPQSEPENCNKYSGGFRKTGEQSTARTSAEASLPSCLNTKTCAGKFHFMRDCPETSIGERKRLVREFREKSSQGTSGALKTVRKGSAETFPIVQERQSRADGRLLGRLADIVEVTVCGDYGADHAAISEHHLAQVAQENVFVPILQLPEPIVMDLAIEGCDEKLQATATKKARLSLTLQLPEGPMRMRNVEFIVFREKMPEVLMSRPLLVSMGFDLDRHLARVREQFHDQDFSFIGFTPANPGGENTGHSRLSRLMYRSEDFDAPVSYLDQTEEDHNAGGADGCFTEFTLG